MPVEHIQQFRVKNSDWLSELSAEGSIGNGRKGRGRLCYGDCVLAADCVRGIGKRRGVGELCVDSGLC